MTLNAEFYFHYIGQFSQPCKNLYDIMEKWYQNPSIIASSEPCHIQNPDIFGTRSVILMSILILMLISIIITSPLSL